jgi:hypothetical protein
MADEDEHGEREQRSREAMSIHGLKLDRQCGGGVTREWIRDDARAGFAAVSSRPGHAHSVGFDLGSVDMRDVLSSRAR